MPDRLAAIKIKDVSKSFRLPHERQGSVKNIFTNFFKGRTSYEKQEVLKDISFEIKKGEFFGIVGRNGSGKSTLLKLLSGIYSPDKGEIEINGKLTPFIELGVGFSPELTGRENVFLNGALLGFSREEMESMYDEIVDFAELEKFMDQKLKNYSSGMQVRLAFSIAVQSQSDILLFDEVLAVGDANFQKKCFDVFKNIKSSDRTVVLVTHDMSAVEQYCDRAILIEKGKIVASGDPSNVTKAYNDINLEEIDKHIEDNFSQEAHAKRSTFGASIEKMWMEKNEKKTRSLTPKDQLEVYVKVRAIEDVQNPTIGITIKDQVGKPLFAINTKVLGIKTGFYKNGQSFVVKINIENIFSDGNYYIIPEVSSEDAKKLYDTIGEGYRFSVSGWLFPAYVMQPKNDFEIIK